MINEIVGFENLHLHTSVGSLLDGLGNPEEYGERWKSFGKYFCISDHGMMSAIPKQIKVCDKNNLTPIFAEEFYVNPLQIEYDNDKEFKAYIKTLPPEDQLKMRKSYHLLAIAANETGYTNLVTLSSLAWLKGFYYKPRVNHEQLMKYKEGIIFTSCCYMGELGQAFDRGGEEEAYKVLEKYMAMFGANYYLEFMLLDFDKQKPYNQFIMKAHDKYKVRLIVSCDTHYCNANDSKYQRYMLMVQTKRTVKQIEEKMQQGGDQDFFELQDTNLWMKSEEELNQKWESDYSNIIDYELFKQAKLNTVKICERAGAISLDRSLKLPEIPNANEVLREESAKGFLKRGLPKDKVHLGRLKEELELMFHKGFSSYFLILKQAVDEAKRYSMEYFGTPIATGPGRGSSAGSLVCYCLGLTNVNPIKHDLLFSRFLSEARDDLPDIDSDFLPEVRDHLKNTWAPNHFGKEFVCNIGSYNTYGIKSALIDMARIFDKDRGEVLNLTTKLGLKDDDGNVLTWDRALDLYPELKKYCEENSDVADAAKKLINRNRSMGQHAGGIIISSKPIREFVPLVKGKDGEAVSSWTEGLHEQDLGPMGFVKYDWLVIKNLEQINHACKLIEERHGVKSICAKPDGENWSDDSFIDDPQVIKLANAVDLKCIFQFDSDGIRSLVRKGGVNKFDDLVDYVSLFRPGPMKEKMHDEYIARKTRMNKFELHPLLEPILGKTLGVIIYQEQCAKILNAVGDIPLKDCETLRKAISKKKEEYFGKYKKMFIANGAKNLGCNDEELESLWKQLEAFAGYGFNLCLTGDTKVDLACGQKVSLKDIYVKVKDGQDIYLQSLDINCKLTSKKVEAVYSNGVQQVYELILNTGQSIKATENHKFLTDVGWKPLKKFSKGNCIAVKAVSSRSDIYWAKVKSIKKVKREETYDLTVHDTHNFIANGIISANSHAVAYTYISCMLLWLKAYYPLEFYTAILHYEDDADKIKEYRLDAKRHDIKVNPVDINKSKEKFSIVDNEIYFGFANIKGIGIEVAKRIVEGQPYSSFADFLTRFGTDESVVKPLLGIRIFNEGKPEKMYVYFKWFKKKKDLRDARKGRYEKKWKKYEEEAKELFGTSLEDAFNIEPSSLTETQIEQLAEIKKGYKTSIESYNKKSTAEEGITGFDRFVLLPDEEQPEIDEKLMKLYPDLTECEKQYYGFIWHHLLSASPDHEGCRTFDDFRDRGKEVDRVEVIINAVTRQVSKKNVVYWLLKVEDENGEEIQMQIWEDDWEIFKNDLKVGELVKLEIKKPDAGFGRYTLYGPPKWKRFTLPKNRENDFRVVVLRKPV